MLENGVYFVKRNAYIVKLNTIYILWKEGAHIRIRSNKMKRRRNNRHTVEITKMC